MFVGKLGCPHKRGWLLGTFAGALAARRVSFNKDSLHAYTVGEVETENKVLVVKRITITLNHKLCRAAL